jgi:hypothetical protein
MGRGDDDVYDLNKIEFRGGWGGQENAGRERLSMVIKPHFVKNIHFN